jgi:hypothetical protein
MTNDEIREKLFSKKSPDRRRAAKEIGKNKIVEFSDDLYNQYVKERNDKRTWETQCEMIRTLGNLNYRKANNIFEEIVKQNKTHDAITGNATTAYVRLSRKSINDGELVLELIKIGGFSVRGGALWALMIDKMIPSEEIIKELLVLCKDRHKDFECGYGDDRKYLAIACANWNIELTKDFLNHCIETAFYYDDFKEEVTDTNLIEVCKNSLKGKYSKAYIGDKY